MLFKVANLWDVSDKDIDRFLASFLSDWVAKKSDSAANVVHRARHACKLKYLVGCSPVCYGVPVHLSSLAQPKSKKDKTKKKKEGVDTSCSDCSVRM